jgi:hypothetical protein
MPSTIVGNRLEMSMRHPLIPNVDATAPAVVLHLTLAYRPVPRRNKLNPSRLASGMPTQRIR